MIDSLAEQDPRKQYETLQKHVKLRIAVRDINDQYMERIAGLLSDEAAAEFRDFALRRGYPRIYTEHGVQRLFKEAKKIEGLDTNILASIEELEDALKGFDGALIVVSHDEAFLRAIGIGREIALG